MTPTPSTESTAERETPTLKPCPFCGNANVLLRTSRAAEDSEFAYVRCVDCGATTEHFEGPYAPRDLAIGYWNSRRPATAAAPEPMTKGELQFVWGGCGCPVPFDLFRDIVRAVDNYRAASSAAPPESADGGSVQLTDEQIDAIALRHPFVQVNREGRFTAVDKNALRALVREALAAAPSGEGVSLREAQELLGKVYAHMQRGELSLPHAVLQGGIWTLPDRIGAWLEAQDAARAAAPVHQPQGTEEGGM